MFEPLVPANDTVSALKAVEPSESVASLEEVSYGGSLVIAHT